MAPNNEPGEPEPQQQQQQQQRERGERKSKASAGGASGGGAGGSSSKSKDLSHVPCKFYKVGGCTAGSSCPFSHSLAEPGGQKETCAWFVKGNCKFGHKCALAHILPGQDMSMDRKNKKAAQQQHQASGGGGKEKKARNREAGPADRERGERGGGERGGERGGGKNALLAGGSTAPTRILNGGSASKPPMLALKATISPSAPAPPLKDSDFASLDDMEGVVGHSKGSKDHQGAKGDNDKERTANEGGLPPSNPRRSAPANQNDFGPIGSPPNPRDALVNGTSPRGSANGATTTNTTSTIGITSGTGGGGTTTTTKTRRWADTPDSSVLGTPGFGDFMAVHQAQVMQNVAASGGGSQQQQQQQQQGQVGQGQGGQGQQVSSSAQHFSTNIVDYGDYRSTLLPGGNVGGIARSVGALQGLDYDSTLNMDSRRRLQLQQQQQQARLTHHHNSDSTSAIVIEDADADGDGDFEAFIPGSLTDLLTPEERNERMRRMSRTNSGQQPVSAGFFAASGFGGASSAGVGVGAQHQRGGSLLGGGGGVGDEGLSASLGGLPSSFGHRYSRSVPATGLLGDMKSIWSDGQGLPASPRTTSFLSAQQPSSSLHHRTTTPLLDGTTAAGGDGGLSISVGSPASSSLSRMISPSNASAAFLPGFHQHYAARKAAQQQSSQASGGATTGTTATNKTGGLTASGLTAGLLSAGGPVGGLSASLAAPSALSSGLAASRAAREGQGGQQQPPLSSSSSNSYLGTLSEDAVVSGSPGGTGFNAGTSFTGGGNVHTHLAANGTAHTYRTTPSPFDLTQGMHLKSGAGLGVGRGGLDRTRTPSGLANQLAPAGQPLTSRDPTFGLGGMDSTLLSPSARALQSHAPGQSLPQGLAAGLSRIHALPPSSSSNVGVVSPGTPSGLSALSAGANGNGNSAVGAGATGTSPAPASLGGFTSGPYGEQPGSLSAYTNSALGGFGERGFGTTYGGAPGGYGGFGQTGGYGQAGGYGAAGYGNFGGPPSGFGGGGGGLNGMYGGFGGYQEGMMHHQHQQQHQQQGWGHHPNHPSNQGVHQGQGQNQGFAPSSLREQAPIANATSTADREGGPPGLGAPNRPPSQPRTSPGVQTAASTPVQAAQAQAQAAMPSGKLSYSAAASRAAAAAASGTTSSAAVGGAKEGTVGAAGIGRGKPVVVQPPVGVREDDDDLFRMDG